MPYSDMIIKDPRKMPANVLAYIGDCVFELYSRLHVINDMDSKMSDIHKQNITIVNAGAQATAARKILDDLTPDELAIFKRGRNANSGAMAKNANAADYRVASGIETLIGYLFLSKDEERLKEILSMLIDKGTEITN